jgi:hypothetical protein
MTPGKSTGLAWSIAIASLLLWVSSATSVWGQSVPSQSDSMTNTTDNSDSFTGATQAFTTTGDSVPCPAGPAAVTPSTAAAAPGPDLSSGGPTQEGSFHLCGPDAQVARAIEQLVAGRGFSASLSTRGDGCADLNIKTTSPASNGRASSMLKVSLGSGQSLSIQIVSEDGATHASIG